MNPSSILIIIVLILSFDFILDQGLALLNLMKLKAELPVELKGIYNEEKYTKSQAYHKANAKFGFITAIINFILVVLVVLLGGFGWIYDLVSAHFGNSIYSTLLFFGILFFASDLIHLPFSIYRTFVIEEKFGFNKTTPKTFTLDKIKGYLLAILVGGLIIGIFLLLINQLGKDFWIWFWLVIGLFMILINMFYTSLIVPLFNKLKPLEEGELKTSIEEYSHKVGFPLTNVFVIDGSKRSTKANAYFSGIGSKKKIVLFDTLINNHSKDELIAVLAHEVGHYKKKHILIGLILSLLQTGIMLYILSLFIFTPVLSQALGAHTNSVGINLIAFGILFTPISHIIGIFMNVFSRKNEYEADRYAAETFNGTALSIALKKLSVDNLSNLTPHPAYVFMHYSHPPLLQRLKALEKIKD